MTHEKIIKDERGTIRIEVKFWQDNWHHKNNFRWDITVWHKAPRKQIEKWDNPTIATPAEILQAKLEFWEMIKPI